MRFGDFLRVVFVSASASIVSAVGCLVVVVFNCVFVFVFVCVSVFVFFFVFSPVFLPPSLLPLHPLSSSCLYRSSSPSSLQLFFSDTFEPRIHPIQTKNNNNKPITKMVAAIAVPKMSYKDMIVEAIVSLKERGGSSRQAIKKYIQSNHSLSNFDNHFNNALKKGVTAGIFAQPKGPVGPVKVVKEKLEPAKKEKTKTTKKVAKKPVGTKAKKELKTPTAKKTASKAAPKKATKVTKATKKAPTKVTRAAPKKATKTTKATKTSKTSKVAPKKAVTKAKKETAKKAAPKKTGKAAKK